MFKFNANKFKYVLRNTGLDRSFVFDSYGYVVKNSKWYEFLFNEFYPVLSDKEGESYEEVCEFLKQLDYMRCRYLFGTNDFNYAIGKALGCYETLSFSAIWCEKYSDKYIIDRGRKFLEVYREMLAEVNKRSCNVRVDVECVKFCGRFIYVDYYVRFSDIDGVVYDNLNTLGVRLEYSREDLSLSLHQQTKAKLYANRFVNSKYVNEIGFEWLTEELILSRIDKCFNDVKNGLKILRDRSAS